MPPTLFLSVFFFFFFLGHVQHGGFLRTLRSCDSRITAPKGELRGDRTVPGLHALKVLFPVKWDLFDTLTILARKSKHVTLSSFANFSSGHFIPNAPVASFTQNEPKPVGKASHSKKGFPKTKCTIFLSFQREPHRKENKKFNF